MQYFKTIHNWRESPKWLQDCKLNKTELNKFYRIKPELIQNTSQDDLLIIPYERGLIQKKNFSMFYNFLQ
jgi:hypothetical protein